MNKPVYDALVALFDKVKADNEGQPIELTLKLGSEIYTVVNTIMPVTPGKKTKEER